MLKTAEQKIPILLTSSVIAYDNGVALKDTNARIDLAIESVMQWHRIDPDLPLVLCDGSNYDFTSRVKECLPSALVECLRFENDQDKVRLLGRGYGEGEIVRYAIRNSKFIKSAGNFAKCTSKLWVDNYPECAQAWNGNLLLKGVFENVFSMNKRVKFSYIDTRFYICSTSTYESLFIDAHLGVRKKKGHGLEDCFHEIVTSQSLRNCLFLTPPIICGVGGGTGKHYKHSVKRKIKEKIRNWLVRANPNYKSLFSNDYPSSPHP